jgi:hypothetical protein
MGLGRRAERPAAPERLYSSRNLEKNAELASMSKRLGSCMLSRTDPVGTSGGGLASGAIRWASDSLGMSMAAASE